MTSRDSDSRSRPTSIAPRSIAEITRAAQEYEYNAQVPLRYWLRTASALLKQADIYMREGDDETTYLLLFRHAHLVLANLLEHPGAKDLTLKAQIDLAKQEVNKNLKVLDRLKPVLHARHERFSNLVHEQEIRRTTIGQPQPRIPFGDDGKAYTAPQSKVRKLRGYDDRDLAVDLARREYDRRASAQTTSRADMSPSQAQADDLSNRLQAVRSRFDAPTDHTQNARAGQASDAVYAYPRVHVQQVNTQQYQQSIPFIQAIPNVSPSLSSPPTLPPKPYSTGQSAAPPVPDKTVASSHTDIRKDETMYTFASAASLENGAPLRTLFLPPTLRNTFLRLAHANTLANLETCAFLAGTLISNALFVSKLIVPAQIATSETCEMTNESQLFDYVDSENDLMILGWIHTHPTQTCFMSSRDLHTHAGYQMMLAESVAIVCAPSKGDTSHGGDWGVYRLTDPPGKMTILKCNQPGIFHPHDVDNIYTDALRPGHVVEAKGLGFEVVDLRES